MGLDGHQHPSFFMSAQHSYLLEFIVDYFFFGYGTISFAKHTHWLSSTANSSDPTTDSKGRTNSTNSFDDISAHSFSHLRVDILCYIYV